MALHVNITEPHLLHDCYNKPWLWIRKKKSVLSGVVLRGEFSKPQGINPAQVLDVVLGCPDQLVEDDAVRLGPEEHRRRMHLHALTGCKSPE